VLFQMYSFLYDESETWAIWSNDIDLLAFNDGSSDIVISQIIRQLFDGVRKQMNDLKDKVQNQKSLLTTKVNNLLTAFEDYRSNVQTNEEFVRYSVLCFYFRAYTNFASYLIKHCSDFVAICFKYVKKTSFYDATA